MKGVITPKLPGIISKSGDFSLPGGPRSGGIGRKSALRPMRVDGEYKGGKCMLSEIPRDLSKVSKKDLNKEICRAGIIAELDAINLYEQLAAMTDKKIIKEVLLDIAKEEKTHVGEFQALLLMEDKEQVKELEEGREEVEEMKG